MLHIASDHPMDDYIELLSSVGKIHMSYDRLSSALSDAKYKILDYSNLAQLQLLIDSCGKYGVLSSHNLINFLMEDGVPESTFVVRGRKSLSFDQKQVVDRLIERGIHTELLGYWKQCQTAKSHYNTLHDLTINHVDTWRSSVHGIVLVYNTTVKQQDNLRAYYSDINAVGIPKIYSSIIVPPGEYLLAWCDFPQADWRCAYNLFIKNDENYKIMQECEDAYEGLARLIEKDNFLHDRFVTSRNDYKRDCLSVYYNATPSTDIANSMRKFYLSCPKYAHVYKLLDILYNFKVPIPCTSYFGYTQMLPEGRYASQFISKGMNTMIQTMTSHLVKETVFGILERFYELGYTKDDIGVYFVRHDEPIFWFTRKVLKDSWVFGDCSTIHIDGFTPFKLDFHFGNAYKDENKQLTAEVYQSAKEHINYMHEYDMGVMHEYNPLPPTDAIDITMESNGDGTTTLLVTNSLDESKRPERYNVNSTDYDALLPEFLSTWLQGKDLQYLYVKSCVSPKIMKVNNTLVCTATS